MCGLSDDIYDYYFAAQGKVTVPSIDDKEDMQFTHVCIYILCTHVNIQSLDETYDISRAQHLILRPPS